MFQEMEAIYSRQQLPNAPHAIIKHDSLETRSSSISTKINLYLNNSHTNIKPQKHQHQSFDYTLFSRYGSPKSINSSFKRIPKRELNNYAIKKLLGQGSFAKVKLCQDLKTGEKLAVKIIEKNNVKTQKLRTSVKREIRLNKLIYHPSIAHVVEMLETETVIFIMMEYIDGGELFDYIISKGHLQEKEARLFFRQIISAIDYLHKSSIVHRDLKPENLLLDSTKTVIKLVDFGLANTWQKEIKLETFCGSPYYAAPEMIAATPYTGPEVDVWSMGVILYAMVSGTLPFDSSCMRQLYNSIVNGDYTIPQFFSAELSRLISKMLRINPLSRYSITEIAQDQWTNLGYNESIESFIPYRSDIVASPHKKSIAELSSFGIKESDIISVLKDPDCKNHPLKALYHLCNETRIRLENEEAEEKKRIKGSSFLDNNISVPWIDKPERKSIRDKLASSKLGLAFKKWIKTGIKIRTMHQDKLNAVKSAQVLPSNYHYRLDHFSRPRTVLDSEETDIQDNFNPISLIDAKPLQTLARKRVPAAKFPWIHKKSQSDGYEFINSLKLNSHPISITHS